MNSSSSPEIVDSAIIRQGSLKNYNLNGSDVDDDIINNSANIQRYTRSTLYLLRNGSSSHRRPECALRTELQSLGVWKFHTGNGHPNNNSANSEGGLNSSNPPSSSGHLNSRIQRSPTTRGGVSSGDYSAVSTVSPQSNHSAPLHQHSSIQKSYIDHRSISSSHLMPAFAKRRIAATSSSQSSISTAGNLTSSYGENSASEPRPGSPQDTKDIPSYLGRQRSKELMKDYRQRNNDDQTKFPSPQRKVIGEHERERTSEHERAISAASPVSVANSRHGQQANLERRIGSGRLLPRDVNWDYHRGQDKDKNSAGLTADKEPVSSHNLQTRGNTGRYAERTHERGGGFIERRSFDRKGVSGGDDNMRDKYETMNSSNNMHNTRRFTSNETSSNVESTSNQYNQQQPSHGRNRRNHQYNDRNEEPEWFSGGPTSQNDTIELRGFEEIDEHYTGNSSVKRTMSRKLHESSSSRASGGGGAILQTTPSVPYKEQQPPNNAKDLTAKNQDYCADNVTTAVKTIEKTTPSTPHIEKNLILEENTNARCETGKSNSSNNNFDEPQNDFDIFDKDLKNDNVGGVPNQTEFNFDAFLNLDPLEHTLMRGDLHTGSNTANTGSSRFSRWFPSKTSRDDDEADLQKLYATNIPSVEELEARMRKVDTNDGVSETSKTKGHETTMITSSVEGYIQQNHSMSQQPTQDMEAFKKMLEQLGSGNNKQHPGNMHLLVQQQANRSPTIPQINMIKPSGGIAPTGIPQPPPLLLPHMLKSEEIKKFIQQQQLIHQQQQHHLRQKQMQPEVLHQTHHLQQPLSPQILQSNCNEVPHAMPPHVPIFFGQPQKRMEAQHLFQCVARGEISLSFLEQELNNSHTSQHAKEIIAEVLRENSRSVTPSAGLSTNIVPPPQPPLGNVVLHQQQILSPLPILKSVISGPTEQRTSPQQGQATSLPSPRDLQYHTQSILQNAVFKKKMEDQQQQQQDALRRRQEMQKQQQQQSGIVMPGSSEMCSQKNLQQLQISTGILQTQHQQQPGPQQSHAPQPHSLQQTRHVNSPTPLAFTPTSVLRKMTADKDNSNSMQQSALSAQQHLTQNKPLAQTVFANQQHSHQQQVLQQPPPPQPRMILGGNHQQQHQQQLSNGGPQISPQTISQQQQPPPLQQIRSASQVKWPAHINNQNVAVNKPMGRPILKGPALPSQQTLQQQHTQQQQQIPQMTFASKLEFQQIQQQRLKNNQTPQHMLNQQSAAQAFPHPMQQQLSQSSILAAHAQQQQHIFHHQRALALQRQQQQLQIHQQLHQPQQQQPDAANRLLGISISSDTSSLAANNAASIINYQRDGGLSPTSNQLAQWFSPELLAQASAGKLPLLNMNQALSLEEFERSIQHSSTAVHN